MGKALEVTLEPSVKKKADWPIEFCEMCLHLESTPIKDYRCAKAGVYLWVNGNRLADNYNETVPYKYMPKWCPLENYE